MSLVQLITSTPDAEKSMAYIARVSNPKNQDNNDFSKLLGYCIKNEHWSVFEQAYICLLYTSPSPRDRQKSRMPSSA